MKRYKVNLSDGAKQDFHESYDYMAGVSSDRRISAYFVKGLNDYIKEAPSHFPARFPVYRNNVRKAVYTKNRNYIILFEIHEETSEVFVLLITNAKQYAKYHNI